MDELIQAFQAQPVEIQAAAVAIPLLALITGYVILSRFLATQRFLKALKKTLENPNKAQALFHDRYSAQDVYKRSALIEKFAEKHGPAIVGLTGAGSLWVAQLAANKTAKDFSRVMKYAPKEGLYTCFEVTLQNKDFGPQFVSWLEKSGDFYVRRLAEAGKGKEFSGPDAMAVFKDKLDVIRETAGDPEWPSRFFAAKILMHDPEERSQRVVWDTLKDPHPLVRTTIIQQFKTSETDRFSKALHDLFVNDPYFEVRQAAWNRAHAEFPQEYTEAPGKHTDTQAIHVLELLRPGSKNDEQYAMGFLDHKNKELRLPAARLLEKSGGLNRLILELDLGDPPGMERAFKLLAAAAEVNVTGFLDVVKTSSNPATLLVAGRVINQMNHVTQLSGFLAEKVFAQFNGEPDHMELYRTALECVGKHGTDAAYRLLPDQIYRWRGSKRVMDALLPALPEAGATHFIQSLFDLLHDAEFVDKEELITALKRMPQNLVLPPLLDMIRVERAGLPHAVRVLSLRLLGEMNLPYCLETVLENLHIMPMAQARDFMKVLGGYPKDMLSSKVENYLGTTDSKVRAAIIAALPVTGDKKYIPLIKKSLKDIDPDVRIATIIALSEYGDEDVLAKDFQVLRDPVERVRVAVARDLGAHGTGRVLDAFKSLLNDPNESLPVKSAAALGLGHSKLSDSIHLLVTKLEQEGEEDELKEDVVQALSHKKNPDEVEKMIEEFKDAGPRVRDLLTQSFRKMGDEGAQIMADLLKQDIPSLRPFIMEVLDKTGAVERQIHLLNNRDPQVRRKAAAFLSNVASLAAFRGIVLAARDPDEDVRVSVIRALEKLESKEGKDLLDQLNKDPDKRVRKYTHWALERLKTKSL